MRTFLNSSRPGYVATRMIGTSPGGVARRRLGGCCKRQHQDCPRRLLQVHHRLEAATERERHGEECRVARIAPTRHGRPSGLKRAKRRFHEGGRVAPDDRDRRPERHDDRHQQRGPRQQSPWPLGSDAAQGGGSARCTRWSFAVRPHDRRPPGGVRMPPSLMLGQNAQQDHRRGLAAALSPPVGTRVCET